MIDDWKKSGLGKLLGNFPDYRLLIIQPDAIFLVILPTSQNVNSTPALFLSYTYD